MVDFFKDKVRKDHPYVSKIICIQNGIMMRSLLNFLKTNARLC